MDRCIQNIHTYELDQPGGLVSCWNQANWDITALPLEKGRLAQETVKLKAIQIEILGWSTDQVKTTFPATTQANKVWITQKILEKYRKRTEVKRARVQRGINFGMSENGKSKLTCNFDTENALHLNLEYANNEIQLDTVTEDSENNYPYGAGQLDCEGNLRKFLPTRPTIISGKRILLIK